MQLSLFSDKLKSVLSVTFDVFMGIENPVMISWVQTLCGLLRGYQRFRGNMITSLSAIVNPWEAVTFATLATGGSTVAQLSGSCRAVWGQRQRLEGGEMETMSALWQTLYFTISQLFNYFQFNKSEPVIEKCSCCRNWELARAFLNKKQLRARNTSLNIQRPQCQD
jgi:hypothetical protein